MRETPTDKMYRRANKYADRVMEFVVRDSPLLTPMLTMSAVKNAVARIREELYQAYVAGWMDRGQQ